MKTRVPRSLSRTYRVLALVLLGGLITFGSSYSSWAQDSREALTRDSLDLPESGEEELPDLPPSASAEALLREVTTKEMTQAIKEGLQFLAQSQDMESGAFKSSERFRIAITSLGGLALLASGSTPCSGPYAENIRKAVDYVLSTQDSATGYFTSAEDASRIHGHGYAMLFLSQVVGNNIDPRLDDRIMRALRDAALLLKSGQTSEGGWGYEPREKTWDEGSTTICCLQGLRACREAGVAVDSSVIAKAMGYLQKIAVAQDFRAPDGSIVRGYHFKYSLDRALSFQSWTQVASAVSCLNQIGVYSKHAEWNSQDMGEILRGGMAWLMYRLDNFMERAKGSGGFLDTSFPYYAHFYAVQATWQYSDPRHFRVYFPVAREHLLEIRRQGGSTGWAGHNYGAAYQTAFSLLVLQMPYQYLPVFQR